MFRRSLSLFRLARNCVAPSDKSVVLTHSNHLNIKWLHLTSPATKEIRVKGEKYNVGSKERLGPQDGEKFVDISYAIESQFPTASTANTLFDGIPYKDLPILCIKCTHNNTLFSYTKADGKVIFLNSAGIEGFKNAKKGTNVAAQQSALTIGNKIAGTGNRLVRLKVQGLGNGRNASIKGLLQAGLKIVSVTDETRVSWNPVRGKKIRRI